MIFSPFDIVIGVTGHRDIRPEESRKTVEHFHNLIDTLLNEIQTKVKRTWSERIPALWNIHHEADINIRVLIGMANGADQLIAKTCFELLEKGVPIIPVAIYPMPRDDYRADFQDSDLVAFDELDRKLREKGHTIIELPAPTHPTQRDQCYANLGLYLADKADIIAAVWDARGVQDPDFKPQAGGTEFIVRHARDPSYRFMHSAGPTGKQDLHTDISGHLHNPEGLPVYRIPAGRQSGSTAEPEAEAGFVTELGKNRIVVSPSMPEQTRRLFRRIKQLKEQIPPAPESHKYRICEQLRDEIDAVPDLEALAIAYAQFDTEAGRLQEWSKRMRLWVSAGTAVLTLVFLFYSKIVPSYWLLLSYAVLFGLGLVLYWLMKPRFLNASQALLRATAESFRIEFFWRALGIIDPAGQNSLARKLPGRDSEGTRLAGTLLKHTTLLGREARQASIDAAKGSEVWLRDQTNYYKEKQSAYHSLEHGLHNKVWWFGIILPAALCILVLLFYVDLKHMPVGIGEATLKDALVFFIALLPVVAAAVELYATNAAWGELSRQYATTRDCLSRADALLETCHDVGYFQTDGPDESTFKQAVFVVAGVHLSQEHMQWLTTMQNRVPNPAHGG